MRQRDRDISVVIPTFNRADQLAACLEALAVQDLEPSRYETVVVVDGSTDGTASTLEGLATPYRLCVRFQENAGPGAARNAGVKVSAGRICVFIDDDMLAEAGFLSAHLRAHDAGDAIVALGSVVVELGHRPDRFARFFADWYAEHDAKLEGGEREPSYMDCYSNNMSMSRVLFDAVGGFAEDLPRSEDVEIGYRAQQRGAQFAFVPAARGRSRYEKGSRQIRRLAFNAGVAAVALHRRHPPMLERMQLGHFCAGRTRRMLACRLITALRIPLGIFVGLGGVLRGRVEREWLRFAYECAYWRGVRHAVDRDHWRRLTWGTQILMFHALGRPHEAGSRYVLPARRFGRQMRWLRLARRNVLPLAEYAACRRESRLPPARSVVLTFDDGYNDNYDLAFPILQRARYPATLFLVTGSLGGRNDWDAEGELAGRPLLSWREIDEMADGIVRYGAHTHRHVRLPSVDPVVAETELERSRSLLQEHLGTSIDLFAYPHGAVDDAARQRVARVGFAAACGTRSGTNTFATPLFDLRRVEIEGTDSLLRFAMKAWTGERHLLRWLTHRR